MSTATLEKIDQIVHLTSGWTHDEFTLLKQRLDMAETETGFADDDEFEITDEQYAELQRRSREVESGKVRAIPLEEFYANVEKALQKA
jgi:putative addiction module component (TIGR02574 family)